MHPLASLEEIAALNAPRPDVAVVALERLADAPAALDLLLAHQRDRDWCVLNLRQVTVASTLAALLVRADRKTGKLARAVARMAAATQAVEDAGANLQRLWLPVAALGAEAIVLAANGSTGRLDKVFQEINILLEKVDTARAAPHPSIHEDQLLGEMERALVSLRDANRSVQRRQGRLHRVIHGIKEFVKRPEDEARHAIPSIDAEFRGIASTVAISTNQILGQLSAANDDEDGSHLLYAHQLVLRDHLSANLAFRHQHFSGPMSVRSLRDLQDVFQTSTPHQAEVGLPARRVTVHLRGLNVLSDANAVRARINEGIMQRGWLVVQGLDALTTALNLDARLIALEESLVNLFRAGAIGMLGAVLTPAAFDSIENQDNEITSMMYDRGCLIRCTEVFKLSGMVQETVAMSRAPGPNLGLRGRVGEVITALWLTRGSEVLFSL